MVVGQGFPIRQQVHAQGRREPGDFFRQTLRLERAGRYDGEQVAGAHCLGQLHDGQGIGGCGEFRERDALAGFGRRGQLQQGRHGMQGTDGV